jgi:nucleoside-diphosphate-sugar epimerase
MKVLFVGGTGVISTACARLAAERGIDLTLWNRGRRAVEFPACVKTVMVDIEDVDRTAALLAQERFDAVVNWIAYQPADIERDLKLFAGRTAQYIFISSASGYQKPATVYPIVESTPLTNPYWEYARSKIACEARVLRAWRADGFPATIVRPSHTYSEIRFPLAVNSSTRTYTAVSRMRQGKKVIVPGDGSSLWVITHASDVAKGLVGLLGHSKTLGEAFHITSDEVMSWDQIYRTIGEALGVEPKLVHIPSDFIAACLPESRGTLLGDKAVSVVFDNSKIKRFVPGYCATVPFAAGIRQTLAWFDADPSRQLIDEETDRKWERVIEAYEKGTGEALRYFRDCSAAR